MSNIEDIWADMKKSSEVTSSMKKTKKSVQKARHETNSIDDSDIQTLLGYQFGVPLKKKMSKVTEKKKDSRNVMMTRVNVNDASNEYMQPTPPSSVLPITLQALMIKISKHVNAVSSEHDHERREALVSLNNVLFTEHTMSQSDYSSIFRDICKSIFKRFADPIEKCRELSLTLTKKMIEHSSDVGLVLPYFFPAILQRIPRGLGYDEELKIFVYDMEAHDAFRRGKAVDRQDKGGVGGILSTSVVETSEEIRLLSCQIFDVLISKLYSLGASSVLHPYFQEIVIYVQFQLKDPYPDIKYLACQILRSFASQESKVLGMKYFAVALVRALLPVLRHRHAKVRAAAVEALQACVMIPDRDKRKGAGTEAIQDLVGFREDNVLPVAGFYKVDVQINYLAEISSDSSVLVREKLVDCLTAFLTVLEDRYDHQTRLLPYLLDLLSDPTPAVSSKAMACLVTCGKQYEDEHPDEIIERRQFGIDGDNRINLDKPLMPPFQERPRLGMRLFVRGNTQRFLKALINELTQWTSHTRIKSAQLLKVVIVFCEEHLTMEFYELLPALAKAVVFSKEDNDKTLLRLLLEICELLGRYIVPETFVHYILPRLRGDKEVVQYNTDAAFRMTVMEVFGALLDGARPSLFPPFFKESVDVLTDPYIIDRESPNLQSAAMSVLAVMLKSMTAVCRQRGLTNVSSEAFLATGRLTPDLAASIRKILKQLLGNLGCPALASQARGQIEQLAELYEHVAKETDSSSVSDDGALGKLFRIEGRLVLLELVERLVQDADSCEAADLRAVAMLLASPWAARCWTQSTSDCNLVLGSLCTLAASQPFAEVSSWLLHVLHCVTGRRYQEPPAAPFLGFTPSVSGELVKNVPLSVAEQELSASVVRDLVDRVLDAFVYVAAENQQCHRCLEILDALLDDLPASPTLPSEACQWLFEVSAVEKHLPLLFRGGLVATADSAEWLLRTLQRLSASTFRPCLQASSAEPLRLAAVSTLGRLFRAATGCGLTDYLGATARGRLLSFDSRPAPQPSIYSQAAGVKLLLQALDDSSDDIRQLAVGQLVYALPFLAPTESATNDSLDLHVFFRRVLAEVTVGLPSEDFLGQVDSLLRTSAALDPQTAITIVRSSFDNLVGIHKAPSNASALFSNVIDHCEICVSLKRSAVE